jgi:hypothetical protein
MPTYYVAPWGNDANDGLGPGAANAWLTPGKAFADVAVGTGVTTVYIAPGTYRSTTGFTVANAGTLGNEIKYVGDVNCVAFDGAHADARPGPVRLTGCDADELPSRDGYVLTAEKAYVEFEWLVLDGMITSSEAYYALLRGHDTPLSQVNRHIIGLGGRGGIARGACSRCIGVGSYVGLGNGTHDHCIAIGSYLGVLEATTTHCIAMASYYVYTGTAYHCLSIGGVSGFTQTSYNSIAIGSRFGGFLGTTWNGLAIWNWEAFDETPQANDCRYLYCGNVRATTQAPGAAAPAPAKHVGWTDISRLLMLGRLLEFDLNFEADMGTLHWTVAGSAVADINAVYTNRDGEVNDGRHVYRSTDDAEYGLIWVTANDRWELWHEVTGTWTTQHYVGTVGEDLPGGTWALGTGGSGAVITVTDPNTYTDWHGRPRPLRAGQDTVTPGPWEHVPGWSEVNYDEAHAPDTASRHIARKGQVIGYQYLEGGVAYDISVWVKWDGTGDKPQLLVRGEHITTQTATATGDGSAFEKLTVAVTPTQDTEAQVVYYARDADAAAEAWFSRPELEEVV